MSFKRLLSNLPFNPSLINRVANYAAYLQQEVRLRRLGILLLIACLVLQLVPLVSLPHRYPNPAILILIILIVIALFCWLRARLLSKELAIVRKEYSKGN